MTTISLDSIVKNILLKRRYPIHYYLDFLIPAKDGLRELFFDNAIGTIRYVILPLNSINQGTIPNDYSDWTGVYVRLGQYLQPLTEDDSLDTIPNYDADFVEQPYTSGVATQTSQSQTNFWPLGGLSPYWYTVNWNSLGENIGRNFGGVGAMADTFKIDTARNIIKVNEALDVTEVVLYYIGNGLDGDSATKVHVYSQAAIEAYCLWQFKENNRTYSEGEAQVAKRDFEQQAQILRARLSDVSIDRLKRIVQGNSISIKY